MNKNVPKAGAKRMEPDFPVVPSNRTGGNSHKADLKVFHINIRKDFFILRAAEHWNGLPREAMPSPSLDIFPCHLLEVTLPWQQGWAGSSPEVPSNST